MLYDDAEELAFLNAQDQAVENLKEFFLLADLVESRDLAKAPRRHTQHHRLSLASQASTDRFVLNILQKIPLTDDVDPAMYISAINEIKNVKHIRGHPDAIYFVTKMLSQRSHLVRLTALQTLPELVGKGDTTVISAAAERLKDWSVDVRRAAVTSLQDTPGELHLQGTYRAEI